MPFKSKFSVKLFCSYCHEDNKYRARMEKALALLKNQDKILDSWSDQDIIPGQNISDVTRKHIKEADIVVFLLSPDFISSEACMEEWAQASDSTKSGPLVRIPIILKECAWKHVSGMADCLALPNDGVPVDISSNLDVAWQQVYEGIKSAVEKIRREFTIKDEFRERMESTEFASQDVVPLQRIFVFPRLSSFTETSTDSAVESTVDNLPDLLNRERILLHGDQLSGKSALCRHILLSLNDESKPVIHIDLAKVGGKTNEAAFRREYESQFHGDYSLWKEQENTTAIVDNLTNSPSAVEHLVLAAKIFKRVVVATSSDTYHAYFRDDERFAKFTEIRIRPLTHNGQEELIRKRVELLNNGRRISDGQIDAIENHVNSVVINNKILPRYPFYILSILQTYEGFMPSNLSVTSFSHCYYVLVLAHLIKSGIEKSDGVINSCFNFLEEFAFDRHKFDNSNRDSPVCQPHPIHSLSGIT